MNPSPSILPALVCLALVILGATTRLTAQMPHTPKPGSPERHAICDAMRAFVQAEYAEKTLPKPVVFKIDTLRVQGDFAYLECLPLFSDGTDAVPQYLPDIGYMHCLQRGPNGWKVILDLSRTDVPDTTEVRQIQQRLPPTFPHTLLSTFWRDLFRKAR